MDSISFIDRSFSDADLLELTHDNILAIYRNWKSSESQLRSKTKELNALRTTVKELQENKLEDKNQILALESVKELIGEFQFQISSLLDENKKLEQENSKLVDLNQQMELLLNNKLTEETSQMEKLSKFHTEFKQLSDRYDQLQQTTKSSESSLAYDRAKQVSNEAKCIVLETKINSLTEENYNLKLQLEQSQIRIQQCDKELAHVSNQLYDLSLDVSKYNHSQQETKTNIWEIELLKSDISRLLKLLEHIPASSEFLRHWQDSHGLSYVGHLQLHQISSSTIQDIITGKLPYSGMHDEERFQPYWNAAGFTSAAELSHLTRVYDELPAVHNVSSVPHSFEEEQSAWVPHQAAVDSLEFAAHHFPYLPRQVISTFLQSMNKIWQQAGRRKLRRVINERETTIAELRRKLANAKPYKGVMAERQIRLLRVMIRRERQRAYNAGHHGRGEGASEDPSFEDWLELDSGDEKERLSTVPQHHRRLCQEVKRLETLMNQPRQSSANRCILIDEIAAKNLLEASLISLEILSKQMQKLHNDNRNESQNALLTMSLPTDIHSTHKTNYTNATINNQLNTPQNQSLFFHDRVVPSIIKRASPIDLLDHPSTHSIHLSQSQSQFQPYSQLAQSSFINNNSTVGSTDRTINNTQGVQENIEISGLYHRDPFLQGAIWLSRNISIIVDDFADIIYQIKSSCLSEVTETTGKNHNDIKDCLNEILLILNDHFGGIDDELKICQSNIRHIIENAACVRPGDKQALRRFINSLPIERERTSE